MAKSGSGCGFRNLPKPAAGVKILESILQLETMNTNMHRDATARPPRIKLAGTVLSMLRLENGRQVRGKLHIVSATGGLLHLENALDEAILVEVMFHVGTCTVRNKARMLFPMWATKGCLQPFEFIGFAEPERQMLQAELDGMIAKGSARVSAPQRSPEDDAAECAAEVAHEESANQGSPESASAAVTGEAVEAATISDALISAQSASCPWPVPSDLD